MLSLCRLCRILGFHDKKTVSLTTAVKITGEFAKVDASDPVKYDFALCHQGISGLCKGRKFRDICADCVLSGVEK